MTRTDLAAIFEAAVDLPPAARAAYLARACGEDLALRAEVEALLAVDDTPAARAFDELLPVQGIALSPDQLVAGRYRIVRVVGEGGMGIVYEARQLDPERRVALKCLRPGNQNQHGLRRFQREAATLAQLQHPGIAAVFDAGVTDGPNPQPFFAMEFVEGPTLLEFLRDRPLRERLACFAEVCDAVWHAHLRGIVHRDLKPSNLLVDVGGERPVPKVLDFGIARASAAVDAPELTRTHEIVGTLAYASPEQIQGGLPVTAASDVWSLGVTLYQILAGCLPFDLRELSLPAAARRLTDEEPERLERRIPAHRGDLATIVHKALAKDPGRRYADAGALGADLRRFLEHEPILARPASALYSLSRFARRHRAVVGGIAIAFLALGAALIWSLISARAEERLRVAAESIARDLRLLVRDVVFDVEAELGELPAATAARRKLLEVGLRYARRLEDMAADDRGICFEVAAAYHRLGKVQGVPGTANLGDPAAAEVSMQRALEYLQKATVASPANASMLELEVHVTNDLAELARVRRDLGRAHALLSGLEPKFDRMRVLGADATADRLRAKNRARLGRLLIESGDPAGARRVLEGFRDELRNAEPLDREGLTDLAVTQQFLGDLYLDQLEIDAAIEAFRYGVARAESAIAHDGAASADPTRLVDLLRSLARAVQRRDGAAAAAPLLERARNLLTDPTIADPADVRQQRALAGIEFALADLHLLAADPARARPFAESYQRRIARLREIAPSYTTLVRDESLAWQLLGRIAGAEGDEAAIELAFGNAIEMGRAALARQPGAVQETAELSRMFGGLAFARNKAANAAEDDLERARLYAAAAAALEQKLELLRTLATSHELPASLQRELESTPGEIESLRTAAANLAR